MAWEAWVTIGTIVLVLYALARNRPADVVLLGGMTFLMTLGMFSDRSDKIYLPNAVEMAAGFGNEGLLTVGVLFVVAAGLTETGGLSLITERLLGRPRSVMDAQLRMMAPVASISGFLNNTPVVAMFMPVINDWCRRIGISPSKLFIPLSYAAILGGVCTLIGTSTNLVVLGLMKEAQKTDPAFPVLGFFTIGAVGLPIAIAGIIFILLLSRYLLPDRQPATTQTIENPRQYTIEMMVQPGSAIDGQTIEKAGLRHLGGVYLLEIERDGQSIVAVGPEQVLKGNDRLIFVGIVDSIVDLQRVRGLVPATNQVFKLKTAERPNRRLIEAVVSPSNPLVGMSIREGQFRTRYDAAVIAVHRDGERVDRKIGDIVLKPGDTLLIEAHPSFVRSHRNSREFFLVSTVEDSAPRRHEKAWVAILILLGLVVAMTFESGQRFKISILNAALVAAGLMVVTRCCSPGQARRSIDWATLLAIGASFGIGKSMDTSGAARMMADWMGMAVGRWGDWGMLAGIYLLTLIFTEIVTNNAAAVLAFPIAKAAAAAAGASFMPFAVAIAVAASCGFATPLGYQTHLMVYGPGGYRFSDFIKIGIPLDILCMIITVVLTPIFFPF